MNIARNFLLSLFLIAGFFPTHLSSQDFEGEIKYKIKRLPKVDTENFDNILDQQHGTSMTYLISKNRYKASHYKGGEFQYAYLYTGDQQKMYDIYADKEYISFRDSRRANYKYKSSTIFQDSTIDVLGHSCYMVLSKSEYGTSKTYYSEDIRINPENFEGHKVGNWYEKLKEVKGALSMKTITEKETYYEVREVVAITPRKVKDEEFALPQKPIAASYDALDKQADLSPPDPKAIRCYQKKISSASKAGGEKFTTYVSFFLNASGESQYFEVVEEDKDGFYEIAIDAVKNCGFEFTPGEIDGKAISSVVYFPVEFLR
ncbi:MAG: hypothetical protein AAGD28_33205 [Bacteroidota bacterium]